MKNCGKPLKLHIINTSTLLNDFTEDDIENRFSNMVDKFINYLKKEKLIKYLELGE